MQQQQKQQKSASCTQFQVMGDQALLPWHDAKASTAWQSLESLLL